MGKSICLLLLLVLISCGTQKAIPMESAKDSVSVIIKESVIYKDSIVYVEIPAEADKVIVADTDTSHLETSVAESEAWVIDGKLNHTIRNKPDMRIPKIVNLPIYITSKETEHISSNVITREVEVEKELNKWQIFRMMLGTVCMIAIGVWLLFKILKRVLVK